MKTDNYQSRLPEHPEPLELAAHEEKAAAMPPVREAKPAATADIDEMHGGGGLGWAALAALAVAVLIGAIYLFSPRHTGNTDSLIATSTTVVGTNGATADGLAQNTVAGSAQAAQVSAADAPDDVVYLFPLNVSNIPDNKALNEVAAKAAKSGAYVTVVAYTDESGQPDYNKRLSEKRAKSVGDYLIAHGVPSDHIKTQGLGQTHAYPTPADDRRAEVHVTYTH